MGLALGKAIGLPFKKGLIVSVTPTNWILETNFWNDLGIWIDTETWND